MAPIIEVQITDEEILFIDYGGYESRNELTISLFKESLNLLDTSQLKPGRFYINTDDVSFKINNTLTFGFTNSPGVVMCPDYIFMKWKEVGIEDYEKTMKNIIAKSEQNYQKDKLFWIGSLQTQMLRKDLWDLGQIYPDLMEIISMEWRVKAHRGQGHGYSYFVSLEDHTKYKYLIDCGAKGYSGRLKFLLFTKRTLFLVNRDIAKQDHFYQHLVAYKHFIPVKEDLSDLLIQLNWADQHPYEALLIAERAKEFAVKYLSRSAVIFYLAGQLERNLPKVV